MSRLKCSQILFFFVITTIFLHSDAQQDALHTIIKASDGDKLLDCSELTDLSAMSLCLSKQLSEVKKNNPSRNYGYPYRRAPTLPPFLIADPQPNSIAAYPKRRIDTFEGERHTRIQGYSEPQYRNFLDLDSTMRPRVAEYRPIFDGYAVPVLLHPTHDNDNNLYRKTLKDDYYSKPVKPATQSRQYSRKQRKGYVPSRYNQPTRYYDRYATRPQQEYDDGQKQSYQKYNTGYIKESQHSKLNNYDRDYYVPANSPIIGDIRRSLLDYTGAADLMDDEPEYVIRSHRIKEMGNDYYPFRRTWELRRDLQVNESKEDKVDSKTNN